MPKRSHRTIHEAALESDEDQVRQFLDQSVDPNALAGENWTPLMHAARGGKASIIRLLIQRGANVHAVNDYGRTALHEAVCVDHAAATRALLQAGADVNVVARIGGTPLADAIFNSASLEIIQALVDAGADVASTTGGGKTVLMWAAEKGHTDLMHVVLSRGATVDTRDLGRTTALAWAAGAGQADAARVLLAAGADVNGDGGVSPLSLAVGANADITRVFLDAGVDPNGRDEQGISMLSKAALAGKEGIVDLLLACGARLESHVHGGGPVFSAALTGRAMTLRRLLAVPGADVEDASIYDGSTALAVAASLGHAEAVDVLLAAGAAVDRTGTRRRTALAEAAARNHAAVMERLVAAGARVDGRAEGGPTPLMVAAALRTDEAVAWLLARGADAHARDEAGFTALMLAAKHGSAPNVRRLLEAGADVNARTSEGYTALICAVIHGDDNERYVRPRTLADDITGAAIEVLLAAGADANVPVSFPQDWYLGQDRTLLDLARSLRAPETVALLERHGAR